MLFSTMQPDAPPIRIRLPIKILREPTVVERTGLSSATLRRNVKAGRFPMAVRLSSQAIGWIEAEVDAWLQARMDAREHVSPATESQPTNEKSPAVSGGDDAGSTTKRVRARRHERSTVR